VLYELLECGIVRQEAFGYWGGRAALVRRRDAGRRDLAKFFAMARVPDFVPMNRGSGVFSQLGALKTQQLPRFQWGVAVRVPPLAPANRTPPGLIRRAVRFRTDAPAPGRYGWLCSG